MTQRNVEEAIKSKMEKLKMTDQLEKEGTFIKERRAKVWKQRVQSSSEAMILAVMDVIFF